ncbi:MAG: hypothetical protein WBG43_06520 [Marinifilaceae bacterium]
MSCKKEEQKIRISKETISQTIKDLLIINKGDVTLMKKGVNHAASLWRESDGNKAQFKEFCLKNYISDKTEKKQVFEKISKNMESLNGHFNEMNLEMNENVQLENGPLHKIDNMFGAYSASSHLQSDFYNNKIAFIIALNFPPYSLKEKTALGDKWNREEWAYARLGDVFTYRIPAKLNQDYAQAEADADNYISAYNIFMGSLLNKDGKKIFPKDMVLLSHWNLRDEIKSSYSDKKEGLEKQEMVYKVMERIITQDIPQKAINSGKYDWNPISNKLFEAGKEVRFEKEADTRYQQILNSFKALKAIDPYCPGEDTYIKRKFSGEMEISVEDCETLFDSFLSSPELKDIAKIISDRLGRTLRPYDIWYDGFKSRSSLDANMLDGMTQNLYPNAKAMEKRLPVLLEKLGWSKERSKYIADKISVDPARGSGHAAGAQMKGAKAHLRTRVPKTGMNYKGYNIAVHEFGHNVEQTISLYDMDYYMLNGVPNTSFTEALAFIFQKRDLFLLDIKNTNKKKEMLDALDIFWSTYEIMGVSMVDISVWKWLYAHPNANAAELKAEVINISKRVWNKYYAPVFGSKDEIILGIYSHMVSYPLYLSAYSFGQMIEYQVDTHLRESNFSDEVDRIYKLGRLTPQVWMKEAVGEKLSVKPMQDKVRKVLKSYK